MNTDGFNTMKDILKQIQEMQKMNKTRTVSFTLATFLGWMVGSFILVGWSTFVVVTVLRWMGVLT